MPELPQSSDPELYGKALANFFQRPWFDRVWAIQEVQACPEVFMHCAQEQVDWDLVGLTAAWVLYAPSARIIRRVYKYSSYFAQAYFMFRGKLHLRDDVPLLRILDHTRGFKCTEPKDRIFAVLQHPIRHINDFAKQVPLGTAAQHPQSVGINPDSNHLQIVIDYAKTTFEVYREVFLRSIDQLHSLEALSFAKEAAGARVGYPSWMPKWDEFSGTPFKDMCSFLYNTSRGRTAQRSYSPQLEELRLKGAQIDVVERTSPFVTLQAGQSDKNALAFSAIQEGELLSLSRTIVQDIWEPADNARYEALQRAHYDLSGHIADFSAFLLSRIDEGDREKYIPLDGTFCDVCHEFVTDINKPTSTATFQPLKVMHCSSCRNGEFDVCKTCHEAGRGCKNPKHILTERPLMGLMCFSEDTFTNQLKVLAASGSASRFETTSLRACYQRLFFTTPSGLTGVGPREMLPGDVVALLYGGRMPFLLREDDDRRYKLISDCYVHGIMDGEAVTMVENSVIEENNFVLI